MKLTVENSFTHIYIEDFLGFFFVSLQLKKHLNKRQKKRRQTRCIQLQEAHAPVKHIIYGYINLMRYIFIFVKDKIIIFKTL
jgi:hypothetical protein